METPQKFTFHISIENVLIYPVNTVTQFLIREHYREQIGNYSCKRCVPGITNTTALFIHDEGVHHITANI